MTANTPAPAREKISDKRIVPVINYLLFFIFLMTAGISGLPAITLIYLFQDEAPDWLKSHYQFQKRTFWIGIIAVVALFVLTGIGRSVAHPITAAIVWIGFTAVFFWTIGRSVMGFNHIFHKRAYPNPKSWLV
ncbi:hypothetical protein PQU92_17550 [Asticcacaulis sp. BYS171W]|uniref:DUF4870 domain-containing protein n=1 Tax=Asticcacaulis aquaticus TaxID=2984212 RepID=A0ABT5HYE2_9CAUL|nr:hypothetical protein [Asticcacaulis aquaticus]MDC7685094.1 hypothetical protein [Asticcacaulis aquaticus]